MTVCKYCTLFYSIANRLFCSLGMQLERPFDSNLNALKMDDGTTGHKGKSFIQL